MENGEEVSSTVSIGVAERMDGEHAESLLRRADKALYQAKNTGKNRTVVS
jgi:diguanylate cyclase (GGDEF)-like protein